MAVIILTRHYCHPVWIQIISIDIFCWRFIIVVLFTFVRINHEFLQVVAALGNNFWYQESNISYRIKSDY
jgi:hypothetical protein